MWPGNKCMYMGLEKKPRATDKNMPFSPELLPHTQSFWNSIKIIRAALFSWYTCLTLVHGNACSVSAAKQLLLWIASLKRPQQIVPHQKLQWSFFFSFSDLLQALNTNTTGLSANSPFFQITCAFRSFMIKSWTMMKSTRMRKDTSVSSRIPLFLLTSSPYWGFISRTETKSMLDHVRVGGQECISQTSHQR